jgi:cytochrome c oxidase cbb3-type subunit IV
MFKYYFEQINNVAIWPLISLIIFFTFFVGLLVYVWRADKSFINKMKNLPLEDDDASIPKATINKHK